MPERHENRGFYLVAPSTNFTFKDICPGFCGSSIVLSRDWTVRREPMPTLGGLILFGADDGTTGRELWKSDGTNVGTTLVADLWPSLPVCLAASSRRKVQRRERYDPLALW